MNIQQHQTALAIGAALAAFTTAAQAQTDSAAAALADIEVVATQAAPTAKALFMGTQSVLSGHELQNNRAATLGATTEKTAGVQSEHFGPNAGRPTIRSLSGSRVQILANELSLQDVAVISGNLPTQIEPFMADNIQIIKGAASVLYGGSAIGGAVNVDDGRIPTQISGKRFGGKIDISGGFNSPNTQMFRLDGHNDSNWAWHLSGLQRQISAYRIPGQTKAAACYDHNEAGSDSVLRDMCQMNMHIQRGGRNPAWFPYLNRYFVNNPSELESEMDRYTTQAANLYGIPNPANPLHTPNAGAYLPDQKGPLTDIVPIPDGKIPNSHLKTQSFTLGTSLIGEAGYIGMALSRYRTHYGVPGFVYTDAWNNDKQARIGYAPANIRADQTRWDLRGALNRPLPGIRHASLSLGYSKAQNSDYLGDTLSSGLDSTSKQLRLEVSHAKWGPLEGTAGVAINHRDIRSSGEDAYMPSVRSQERGLFMLEKANFDPFYIEVGARWDKIKHRRLPDNYQDGKNWADYLNHPHDFSLQNQHIGLQWQVNDYWQLKLQRSWSERAPEVNELYASNRHLATLSVEEGNPNQQKEKAHAWELSSQLDWHNFSAHAAVYRSQFKNYSYLAYTGLGISRPNTDPNSGRLLIRQWRQQDATVSGAEVDLRYRLPAHTSGQWSIGVFGDWVRNRPRHNNETPEQRLAGDYMPGMPTSRYGAELAWERQGWRAAVGAVHYQKQKNVGKIINSEPILPGYTLIDAHLSYSHKTRLGEWEWYLDGKNLTNREARPFNSTLKYLAPLPGRAINTGIRWHF
ncbi:TonB-dependent receptor [Paralysiella testudinis]|uniref:TonB-dependent receptor n=1 Tax=Paralysiella testudinis TaxID=2809020 RepID=A0A892ZGQ7_9NEIS|nr:TonB-dependent receptor [Paralysiella testudinis]QRQ81823.1 TonB-dependent receptor [Paralysiella testudinis]